MKLKLASRASSYLAHAAMILAMSVTVSAAKDQPVGPKASEANRKLVIEFYDAFFNKHEMAAAEKFLAEGYKQHNPMVPDGRKAVTDFFAGFFKSNPDARAKIVRTAVEGDIVWLHVHATSNKDDRGQAVIDIFRVQDGKIVEHWDVVQDVPEKSANNNTMF